MKSKRSRRSTKSKTRLPRPVRGALNGYSTHDPAEHRRRKLRALVKAKSYKTVIEELNLISIYNKNNPTVYNKIRADMKYLKAEYR